MFDLLPTDAGRADRIDELVKECLLHHLYREGDFESADVLIKEARMPADLQMKEPYIELARLLETLRDGDIEPSSRWVRDHADLVGEAGARLQFEMAKLKYVGLLRAGQANQALTYARLAFPAFTHTFSAEVQPLLGCLAFANRLDASPYAHLLTSDVGSTVCGLLSTCYCTALHLPQESAFTGCLRLGTTSLPKIARITSLIKEKRGVEWSQADELPVEIDLPPALRYHSVFVCTVLRQQTTNSLGDNPPMMMPCGHVLCLEALTRLSKGNAFVRFKCPYCPADSSSSQAIKVHF